jgi:MFS family permease
MLLLLSPIQVLVLANVICSLTGAVGFMVVGRLTDIFGRRWFFIIGSSIALVGSIVCATAPKYEMSSLFAVLHTKLLLTLPEIAFQP